MKNNMNVTLNKIPKDIHDMYEMGILFDGVYQINDGNCPIGLIYISDMENENIYIEWLEILSVFRGKGYLREIMNKLSELFKKEIRFECSEDLRLKYLHVGCHEHGIDEITENYQMTFNEAYSFECNMSEEYGTYNSHDEWGCAIVSFGNIGAEYNFCIDGGKNLSAIYKTELNPATDCIETDTSTFIHYEIDFSNPEWKSELETAMYSFVKEKKINYEI